MANAPSPASTKAAAGKRRWHQYLAPVTRQTGESQVAAARSSKPR